MSTIKVKNTYPFPTDKKSLIYETENHIFRVRHADVKNDTVGAGRIHGTIEDKNRKDTTNVIGEQMESRDSRSTRCGSFMIHGGDRNQFSINLNLDCKFLLADFIDFLTALENKDFEFVTETPAPVEVEEPVETELPKEPIEETPAE